MSRASRRKVQRTANRVQGTHSSESVAASGRTSSDASEKSVFNHVEGVQTNAINKQTNIAEEEHRIAERAYWKEQLSISNRLNIITAVGTVSALVGLFFLWLTFKGSEDATFQANRAWLSVKDVSFGFEAPYATWTIDVVNVGRDPAENVNFSVPIITWPLLHNDLDEMETIDWPNDNTCKYLDPSKPGIVIVPDPSGYKDFSGLLAGAAYAPFLKGVLNGTRGNLITGCVSYSTFGRIRYSQYCFLGKKMPDGQIDFTACSEGPYTD